ncbi:MAG: DUF2255 family protein [Chloroflexota bacterium]
MSGAWTAGELRSIGDRDEVDVSSLRADGTVRPYVTIWLVRVGDELYVRSAYGPANGWFRRAVASGRGRVRAGGLDRDVTFEVAGPEVAGAITAAYHAKYDRYGPAIVGSVVSADAVRSTLRLVPR